MKYYERTIIPVIESHYKNMSALEKNIADFFIKNHEQTDFSSKAISEKLFVSEAMLSRFAKKCGFKGYREFVYRYKESLEEPEQTAALTDQMRTVFDAYQELINKSYNLISEAQLRRIVDEMTERKRVFVYGRGSSGLAAREMQLRFMRLGLDIEAMDDSDLMRMNAAVIHERCMVFGISISGETEEVVSSLKQAYGNGAYTVLITAYNRADYQAFCNEVVLAAARKNLNYGKIISPQFPVQLILDILYGYYQERDQKTKEAYHIHTLAAIHRSAEQETPEAALRRSEAARTPGIAEREKGRLERVQKSEKAW